MRDFVTKPISKDTMCDALRRYRDRSGGSGGHNGDSDGS